MITVGITGGMGSGKSRACRFFADLGVSVYDSDLRAKELLDSGGLIRESIMNLLGSRAYANGALDRVFVAGKIFKDRLLLKSFNAIIHPVVAEDFRKWTSERQTEPYVLLESAILFESGFDGLVDKVITVSAPEEIRIVRVMSRDGSDRASVLERMANQMTDGERERHSDYVIINDGTIEDLSVKVDRLNKLLISCK